MWRTSVALVVIGYTLLLPWCEFPTSGHRLCDGSGTRKIVEIQYEVESVLLVIAIAGRLLAKHGFFGH